MKRQTIVRIFHEINSDVFNNAIDTPLILCKRWRNAYAQHVDAKRTILEFNIHTIKGEKFARNIVYHEMIHAYLHQHGIVEKCHHGEKFWRIYNWFNIGNNFHLREKF